MKAKNLVVRAVAVAVVLSSVAAFGACGNGEEDKTTTSVSETSVSAEVETEVVTEEFTEPTTEPVEEIPLVKTEPLTSPYVTDVLVDNGPYSGDFYCTGESGYNFTDATNRLPQLTIDSEDAKEINEFILDTYSGFFSRDRYVRERVDYAVFKNGNVLSLAVEQHYDYNNSYDIGVFNIDVSTGKKLDTAEVVALSGKTMEDVYGIITEDVEASYADKIASVPQLQEKEWQDALNDTKARTLEKDNLEQAKCYFDGNGKLVITYKMHWIAGAEIFTEFLPTDVYFIG